MMSVVRLLLLILGIVAVVFGAAMYTENQEFLEGCHDDTFGFWGESPVHEENCRVASGNVIFGMLSMVVGTVLIALSVIAFVSARRGMMSVTQNCPQCQTIITRQSSPKNCSNCGSQVDWSDASSPQK
jgi:RsiW-degrading membrane proteinase PrsW (M82 family)